MKGIKIGDEDMMNEWLYTKGSDRTALNAYRAGSQHSMEFWATGDIIGQGQTHGNGKLDLLTLVIEWISYLEEVSCCQLQTLGANSRL